MYLITHKRKIMSKNLLRIIASLSFSAAAIMFVVGSNSGHLSELLDFCWVPLPLGIAALWRASKMDDATE